jgi:hypothetical protein
LHVSPNLQFIQIRLREKGIFGHQEAPPADYPAPRADGFLAKKMPSQFRSIGLCGALARHVTIAWFGMRRKRR